MKLALALAVVLFWPVLSFAQDPALRSRAVALLERTHAVSDSPNLPNLERVDRFVVFDPLARAREGSFTRVMIQGSGRRDEIQYGDYHLVDVFSDGGTRRASSSPPDVIPREVAAVMRWTPIRLYRFDSSDVIRAIVDTQLGGRSLHCIEFDTVVGERRDSNTFCVDATSGVLVSVSLGNESVEYSDFFPFAGALMPGKIAYSVRGTLVLEIMQTMTPLTTVNPGVLEAPPGSVVAFRCTTVRHAIGQFMPQPEPGRGGRDWDVVLRGIIAEDGKVHGAVVQISERDDLNAEALEIIARWTFLPPLCDGRPNISDTTFVLHFRSR